MEDIREDSQEIDPIRPSLDLSFAVEKLVQMQSECAKVLIGQEELIDLLLTGLLAQGHILLEGVPGIAKTLSAKVLAKTLAADFSRIQFTPDLMPSDIIGTSIFNLKSSEFEFKQGPIFSNVILIDEINRAPAKTQAALFEVMEEHQVTFDGDTMKMSDPFIVMATQNPIEQEGTYRLPEGQLDRFLMKIKLSYPSEVQEVDILRRFRHEVHGADLGQVNAVLSRQDIADLQSLVGKIYVEDDILTYISALVRATRTHGQIYLGASPRAALALMKSAKVAAIMSGRDFVIPDDVQEMAVPVLNHRLILSPTAEIEGMSTDQVIQDVLQTIDVPR
ncbi:MAG: MoxR family ATPase [Saprospiraceae bacterium]|nr:MoxR family ATPase [Saprospiraceae bacterium]